MEALLINGLLCASAGVGGWWGVVGFAFGGSFLGWLDFYRAVKIYGVRHGVFQLVDAFAGDC